MHDHEAPRVPRGALIGAAVMIALSISLAAAGRVMGASERPTAAVVASVSVRFSDRPDGSIAVSAANADRVIHLVPPGSGGFVRGVLRGMFRTRKLEAIDRAPPFTLTRDADGAFALLDPVSGRRVDLRSFGPTNREAFEAIWRAAAVDARGGGAR
jgi:putative photosynthetic complex assembly protein